MDRQGEEVHLNTEEARGGKTGMGVRYVLAISLTLSLVAFAALWLLGSRGPAQSGQAEETAGAPGPIAS